MQFDLASFALGFFSAYVASALAILPALAMLGRRPRSGNPEGSDRPARGDTAPGAAPDDGSGKRPHRRSYFTRDFYGIEGPDAG